MAETIEAILSEDEEYSSYSAEESFTLSDILAEKDEIDDSRYLLKTEFLQKNEGDDFGGMFSSSEEDEEKE